MAEPQAYEPEKLTSRSHMEMEEDPLGLSGQ